MSTLVMKLHKEGVQYEYEIHRAPEGHFAMWRCSTCGSTGGTTAAYRIQDQALAAAKRSINGHHRQIHASPPNCDLTALVYCSRAIEVFDESLLRDLERESAEKNQRLDITGYLHYDASSELFIQFLEGPQFAVEELMEAISVDPRHRILSLLWVASAERDAALIQAREGASATNGGDLSETSLESSERLFPDWRMKYVGRPDFRALNLEETLNTILIAVRVPSPCGEQVCRAVADLCAQLSGRTSPKS